MRHTILVLQVAVLCVRLASAQVDSRRLHVGVLRSDGIVTLAFIVTDSSVREVKDSDISVPLPPRWFITPHSGAAFEVRSGVMLRVFRYWTESSSLWDLGQVTDAPRTSVARFPRPDTVGLALGLSVPAAVFRADSSPSATRDRLLSLLRIAFVDSSERQGAAVQSHRTEPVPPRAPIREVRTWWAALPGTQDTLYVAHAERWYSGGEVRLFDVWATGGGGNVHVIRSHGPSEDDLDYKGNNAEEPLGLFTYHGRTFVIFLRFGYFGTHAVLAAQSGVGVAELSP
jgi:hypothetical protein